MLQWLTKKRERKREREREPNLDGLKYYGTYGWSYIDL
jgi:hypothetical protein